MTTAVEPVAPQIPASASAAPAIAVPPVAPPVPVIPAPVSAAAPDLAAIRAAAASDAIAEHNRKLVASLGLAPESNVDPAAAMATATRMATNAAIQSAAVRAGVRDPAEFALTMLGHSAAAVDLSTGAVRDPAALDAAIRAKLSVASYWLLPTPSPVSGAPAIVPPAQQLPSVPGPTNPPTHVPQPRAVVTADTMWGR